MFNKLARRHAGFTLVEIMIVVAIIALLAAIAVPGFLRARKRSQASKVLNDLRMIDSAVDQYAIETSKSTGSTVAVTDWTNYVKKDSAPYASGQDLFGSDQPGRQPAARRRRSTVFPKFPPMRGTRCRMWRIPLFGHRTLIKANYFASSFRDARR